MEQVELTPHKYPPPPHAQELFLLRNQTRIGTVYLKLLKPCARGAPVEESFVMEVRIYQCMHRAECTASEAMAMGAGCTSIA